jgi:hypothetical protein
MIGLVSESLKNLLEAEMSPATKVTLLSPVETSSHQKRVNLFLYRVVPNAHLYNRDFQPKPGMPDVLLHPPLALNLFYLLTPFAQRDPETGDANAHAVMGEAMRVLHEHPIVPQSALEAPLVKSQVKITLHTAETEELSKVWTALEKELRLSAVYEVSFVDIVAKRDRQIGPRVAKTDLTVTVADTRPSISGFEPHAGVSGSTVVIAGNDLAGWTATVRIAGQLVLNDVAITTTNRIEATVPVLPPGVYELDADVSGLARFTGFFEVKP